MLIMMEILKEPLIKCLCRHAGENDPQDAYKDVGGRQCREQIVEVGNAARGHDYMEGGRGYWPEFIPGGCQNDSL